MNILHQQISPNFYRVKLGDFYFWFSYATLIGFRAYDCTYIDETFYSKTTSKHKNYLKKSFKNSSCVEVEKKFLVELIENEMIYSFVPKGK